MVMNIPLIHWPFLLLAGYLEQQKRIREMKERNEKSDDERKSGHKQPTGSF
jgi:hypothetical protein